MTVLEQRTGVNTAVDKRDNPDARIIRCSSGIEMGRYAPIIQTMTDEVKGCSYTEYQGSGLGLFFAGFIFELNRAIHEYCTGKPLDEMPTFVFAYLGPPGSAKTRNLKRNVEVISGALGDIKVVDSTGRESTILDKLGLTTLTWEGEENGGRQDGFVRTAADQLLTDLEIDLVNERYSRSLHDEIVKRKTKIIQLETPGIVAVRRDRRYIGRPLGSPVLYDLANYQGLFDITPKPEVFVALLTRSLSLRLIYDYYRDGLMRVETLPELQELCTLFDMAGPQTEAEFQEWVRIQAGARAPIRSIIVYETAMFDLIGTILRERQINLDELPPFLVDYVYYGQTLRDFSDVKPNEKYEDITMEANKLVDLLGIPRESMLNEIILQIATVEVLQRFYGLQGIKEEEDRERLIPKHIVSSRTLIAQSVLVVPKFSTNRIVREKRLSAYLRKEWRKNKDPFGKRTLRDFVYPQES